VTSTRRARHRRQQTWISGGRTPSAAIWTWYFSTRAGRLDIQQVIDGPGGYAQLAPRAVATEVGGAPLLVISLADLVESKEIRGRAKDLVALDELRRLRDEK